MPVGRQFETFASAMVNFDLSRPTDGPFTAVASVWRVGALVITQARVDPVIYDRGIARIAADEVDHLYVNYHVAGGSDLDDGSGPRHAGTGQLLVIDMRQPCRMVAHARRIISLAIPRHLLLPRLEPFNPHGLIAKAGLTPLLGATLQAVCATLAATPAAHGSTVERLIVDLVAETLRAALSAANSAAPRETTLLVRVHAYLDAHLGERLDVATICRDLGVSRSSLYRVCGGSGGVLSVLQQRRLRRMRALLEDRGETRPIAEMAEATGFRDRSHFSRAFKRGYGLGPSEYRRYGSRRDLGRAAAAEHAAARLFGRWVTDVN